jgi:hypothetical protein
MQKSFRILVAITFLAISFFAWRFLFPSPERVIRSRLQELATLASYQANEGAIAKAYNATQISGFFTPDVVVTGDIPGYGNLTVNGRDNLMQGALAARQRIAALKVEFLDVNVTIGSDGQTAVANLTAKATASGERDFSVQEFNFMLKKVDGKWLIYRVESVKTLSGLSQSFSISLTLRGRERGRGRAGY